MKSLFIVYKQTRKWYELANNLLKQIVWILNMKPVLYELNNVLCRDKNLNTTYTIDYVC